MHDRDALVINLDSIARCLDKDGHPAMAGIVRDAIALLKEQDEERKRLISWMGKFCAHVDTDFQPMPDEENTRFFCEKMRTQFGWEVSGDG